MFAFTKQANKKQRGRFSFECNCKAEMVCSCEIYLFKQFDATNMRRHHPKWSFMAARNRLQELCFFISQIIIISKICLHAQHREKETATFASFATFTWIIRNACHLKWVNSIASCWELPIDKTLASLLPKKKKKNAEEQN